MGWAQYVQPAISDISQSKFFQLMRMIESAQARMEERFFRLQAEVQQGEEEAAFKAVKWAHYEKPYSFMQKGSEV